MQGLGNDFVVIDAINQSINLTSEQIRHIADRHFGIGCDQLLLVEPAVSNSADFRYRIFNADGSEVAQCGNGARCFARFVRDKQLTDKNTVRVETHAGQLLLTFTGSGQITVNMGIPCHAPDKIPLKTSQEAKAYTLTIDGVSHVFGAVSMGNPHAVLQVADISTAPVLTLGAALEKHPFFPERVNVGFMQIINPKHILLRVYERGAAETLACGSGACAAVVVGIEQGLLSDNVKVTLPGGNLDIQWQGRSKPVFMTGPALTVFEGNIEL